MENSRLRFTGSDKGRACACRLTLKTQNCEQLGQSSHEAWLERRFLVKTRWAFRVQTRESCCAPHRVFLHSPDAFADVVLTRLLRGGTEAISLRNSALIRGSALMMSSEVTKSCSESSCERSDRKGGGRVNCESNDTLNSKVRCAAAQKHQAGSSDINTSRSSYTTHSFTSTSNLSLSSQI